MEEKKIVVYVLHGFWENEFTNGCAVVDVSIDLEYFEIWDENGQSAKFYIVEQYLELSQSMMEAIAESLAKGAEK